MARLTAHLLAGTAVRVGVTTTDGVSVDGRSIQYADATGPRSAQMVLGDPGVEAAVLETARGGTLRRGPRLRLDRRRRLTNITDDHLGQDGLASIEDLVARQGPDRRTRPGRRHAGAQRRRPVGAQPRRPARVRADRKRDRVVRRGSAATRSSCGTWASGGMAYLLRGRLAGRRPPAPRRTPLVRMADVPGAYGGAAPYVAANALAAIAAARALGAPSRP